MFKIILVVCAFQVVRAANFSNPVIEPTSDVIEPRCFSTDLDYYCVITQIDDFVLLHSRDLQNWTTVGFILETPRPNRYNPHLFVSNEGEIRLYVGQAFNDSMGIGVAVSEDIEGPYNPIESPLLLEYNTAFPFAFEDDNGTTYLYYTDYANIKVQTLAEDLLSVNTEPIDLQSGVLSVYAPYVIKREEMYYLFYSTGTTEFSMDVYVSRSSNPTGSFEEKLLIEISDEVTGFGQFPGVVKGPDGDTDVLLYQSYDSNFTSLGIFAKTLIWEDGWPYAK